MPARVWDNFLTEQDRAHLAMSTRRGIGFGEKPALLLVDLYRWVFGDKLARQLRARSVAGDPIYPNFVESSPAGQHPHCAHDRSGPRWCGGVEHPEGVIATG